VSYPGGGDFYLYNGAPYPYAINHPRYYSYMPYAGE